MKQVVLGFVLAVISVLVVAAILTVSGRGQKERELHNALQSAVRETLQTMEESGESGKSEDLEKMLRDGLQKRLKAEERKKADQNFALTIHVKAADREKGILSCHVTEKYTHLNGKIGKTEADATAIIEEDVKDTFYKVTYNIPGQKRTYKQYVLKEGELLAVPPDPKISRKHFSGWKDEAGKPLNPKERVTKNRVFLAED